MIVRAILSLLRFAIVSRIPDSLELNSRFQSLRFWIPQAKKSQIQTSVIGGDRCCTYDSSCLRFLYIPPCICSCRPGGCLRSERLQCMHLSDDIRLYLKELDIKS